MAKIQIGNPSRAINPKAKDAFIIRADPRTGPVAQAWPRKRPGGPQTPYDWYKQTEFGIAAHYASSAIDLDIASAQSMAQGTMYVYRDVLMKAMFGYLWEFRDAAGNNWQPMRDVSPNPQLILEGLPQA